MKISRDIITDLSRTYGRINKPKFLTIHQTGNTSRGADAKAHNRLQHKLNRDVSWHWQVDDTEAIQSYTHDVACWHAATYKGNTTSVGVEICINEDGDYNKSVENGAKLAAMLLKELGLSINEMVQHWDWNRKNCPQQIREGKNGITWEVFRQKVRNYLGERTSELKPNKTKPTKSIDEVARLVINGKYGNGAERRKKLEAEGYNASEVQQRVNEIWYGVEKKTEQALYHKVKDGDTLWGLSRKYGTTVEALVKLNGIKNPNLIINGTQLRIR